MIFYKGVHFWLSISLLTRDTSTYQLQVSLITILFIIYLKHGVHPFIAFLWLLYLSLISWAIFKTCYKLQLFFPLQTHRRSFFRSDPSNLNWISVSTKIIFVFNYYSFQTVPLKLHNRNIIFSEISNKPTFLDESVVPFSIPFYIRD